MKLTKEFRETLIRKVVQHVFKDRYEAISARENAIARKIYEAIYDKPTRDAMDKLPDDFFSNDSFVFIETEKDASPSAFNLSSPAKVSASDRMGWRKPRLTLDHSEGKKIFNEVSKFHESKASLINSKIEFREKLASFIYGISTLKRLDEEWPEWRTYHDSPITKTTNLPAIRGEEITKLIASYSGKRTSNVSGK